MTLPLATSATAARLELSASGIGWLVIDVPGRKLNVLSSSVLEQIDRLLDEAGDRNEMKALAVISAKPGSFIAGVDVTEIGSIHSIPEGEEKARRGQSIFHRLGNLGKPTLAAIDGACLGGGLELALACNFRLATLSAGTRLGFPETRLGIIPGFGGTQRLPRLTGLPAALDLILTGRTVDAVRAEQLRIVDRAVPVPYLRAQAEAWLHHAIEKTKHGHAWARLVRRQGISLRHRLAAAPVIRPIILRAARHRLDRSARGVYPAPYVALDAINVAFKRKLDAGLKLEAALVAPLLLSPTSKSLTLLFRAGSEARQPVSLTDPATGRPAEARSVHRAAVLGAGVMGAGIAHLLARNGIPVRLKDVNSEALVRGMQAAATLLRKDEESRPTDRRNDARIMQRIAPSLGYDGMKGADIVIEAVVEDLAVKQAVLAEVEAHVRPDCVLATNASSLSVAEIARKAAHPERVVGLHFFNPVHRMPLLEIIPGPRSAPGAIATAHELARRLGRTPILVRDTPGFLVNRVLISYLAEALKMFTEGCHPLAVDRAMQHFGMQTGPFALLDLIGFDTVSKTGKAVEEINAANLPRSGVLPVLIEKGRLGVKSGKGFYHYRNGRMRHFERSVLHVVERHGHGEKEPEAIQERLYLPMVNEAVRCLTAGVARSPTDIDLGMVLGAGFPPFRGGPLRNADVMGIAAVVERMNRLAEKHGERFSPDPGLVEMALGGRRFYPAV